MIPDYIFHTLMTEDIWKILFASLTHGKQWLALAVPACISVIMSEPTRFVCLNTTVIPNLLHASVCPLFSLVV